MKYYITIFREKNSMYNSVFEKYNDYEKAIKRADRLFNDFFKKYGFDKHQIKECMEKSKYEYDYNLKCRPNKTTVYLLSDIELNEFIITVEEICIKNRKII